ncbi:LTA synthase family protein [Candidatus Endomicrobiellum devescovinae]|jgi:phosphoglycerol transferase MdoB-like AlkP superfamily enzyme|uniref:LTA synthase family protein n=1 Tax=Candidatus Endomicrobiellum devescovinae TaxID=3242322 RepID=UPI002826EE77|nr:LTA synthase family protein [Endomicrobium sp.]
MSKKFNFENYIDCVVKIIPLNVAALAAMTLYRIFFFFFFKNIALFGHFRDIFNAFVLGLRFDLSILAYINSFVILIFTILLLIRNLRLFKKAIFIIKLWYCLSFIAIALATAIDFGFYICFGEHVNILLFDFFDDDTFALIKTIISDWRFYIALPALILVVFIICKIVSISTKELLNIRRLINSSYLNVFVKILIVLLIPLITFLFARGTVSMFPLGKFHAQISTNSFINNIALTAAHSITDAIQAKTEQSRDKINIAKKLGLDEEDIDLSIFSKISIKNTEAEEIKPNVVFIVLESFGELPVLYNSEKFNILGELKKHFDEDLVLYNFLPAGVITIHCLESTILNMPQRPFSIQVTQSPKAYKHFSSSLILPYKKSGYVTKAVYGGSLAWRGLEDFLKAQGFDEIYGEGSIKNEHRHEWGINDAQFFEIVLRELKNNNKPQFIYAMSTATHPPYKTPPYYKPLKLEIPKELEHMMPGEPHLKRIFETYQFANREASKFLDIVKNSEFKDNTIVVITGDHNLREVKAFVPEELFKRYAVPMYLYVPEKLKKKIDANITACHIDIAPTLYDLSLSQVEYIAAGVSMLDQDKNHIAFNSNGFILSRDKAVLFNIENGKILYFNFDAKSKILSLTEPTDEHNFMLEYYKRTISASDMYINQK